MIFKRRRASRAAVTTVLQMEAVECGAAALAMILAYHGRLVPLEELRAACGVSRDGSKASNILKAARGYGLTAQGFRKEPEQLRDIALPAIIHWNFNHFLVLEGFGPARAFLNDPARGPTVVPLEEFDQAFTGVALVFQRGPDFQPGGTRPSLVQALAPRVAGSHAGLLFAVLAGLALVIPGIVGPTYSRVYVDDILIRGLSAWLRPLLILMTLTAVVMGTLTWLRSRALQLMETKLSLKTSSQFMWHVLQLPYEFFTQRYAGELANRVSVNDRVARLVSGDLATTLLNIIVIVFYAVLMLQYDVVLTIASVAVVLLNFAVLRYVSRLRTDLNARLLQDRSKLMGVAFGGLQTIETLKASGSESDFFARWAGHHARVINATQHLSLTTDVVAVIPTLLLQLNIAILLGLGGLRVINGHLSIGMLMAFQALMFAFVAPVNRMVSLGGTLQEVKGDLNRLDDVLRARVDPTAAAPASGDAPAPDDQVKLTGELELRGVTFGYARLDPPLIADFSLHLKPGSRVALVGGSGSGKSTAAKLVAGLYEPWSGDILFDGKPRREIPRSVMTNSLAIVDQDTFLFENTIQENITLWDGTIPDVDVLQAADDASIDDEIVSRADGYKSMVEEGGRNFSGGQRQRLEIARALARNPTLLVLDEATSALDPTTERLIDDNLRRRGCTCLLVAHRLSTIRDCDEIVVMDRGRIVQRGTHAELSVQPGRYRDLIAAE